MKQVSHIDIIAVMMQISQINVLINVPGRVVRLAASRLARTAADWGTGRGAADVVLVASADERDEG